MAGLLDGRPGRGVRAVLLRRAGGASGSLGVLLALETLLLVAIIVGVFVNVGPGEYPLRSFSPAEIFSGTPGIALAFVFSTFLGFEATAIFSEEARDPKRTVSRATYVAIAVIALLYLAASWSAVAAVGASDAVAVAAGDPGAMIFAIAGDNTVPGPRTPSTS